jgi:outer membrane usher protein
VQLASDERMLPESERGFAPVIRGIAQTNAKVSVRQNGNLVYETTVAPGAFVIDDLYATAYAGDLTVTITEADGRTRSFAVPYAAGVEMLRPGTSRFNVAGGVYRDTSLDRAPAFVQGHYRRGISNRFTLYGGGIVGQGYGSVLAGAAMATPIGAFGVDATVARASAVTGVQDSRDMSGRSLRASYSKTMASTGTRFGLAAYRFSSEDYLSFNDYARVYGGRGDDVQHERTRFQATVGQSLGDWGDLYLSGSTRQYWDGREDGTTFQAGYSKGFAWGSLNVNLSREMRASEPVDTLMATISIPLGGSANRPLLGASVTHDSDGNSTVQTRVDGTLGETHAVTYSAYVNGDYGNGERSHGFGASGSYRTAKARLGASYSQGEGYRQVSASASGTVVAHSGGVTFSPDTGDTFALVVAEGAEGARVANGQGIRLDGDGEALTAGVTPYRHNRVGLDPKGLSDDVELQSTSQDVVPRSGAVVRIEYETETGRGLLLTVEGDTVPFGADVVNADGQSVAVVGQGGFIFLRGEHGPLRAVWGQSKNESCQLHYTMPAETATSEERYLREEAACVPGAAPATTAAAGPSTKR